MTRARSQVRTTVQHRFTVPNGGDASDLSIALHWANKKADELGIDRSYDDWYRVESDDEEMAIVITEKGNR